jgi:predicted alpha/beta superfamily hydrolase
MKKALILICSLVVSIVSAQIKGAPISFGDNYTISSKILNTDREIQIYLPDSYVSSKQRYPVLYILDGQWFFSSGVSVQKALRTPDAIPEMIVVGIKNSNPLRRSLFSDESYKFTDFLKKEVISFVDSKFRTNKERIIFGWEAAAYYISETILKEKGLFTGGIVTDGGYASEEIVKDFKSSTDVYLYMANSKKDIFNIKETEAFNKILIKNNPKNLHWKYELFNDEVHETLGHLALYKGIKYYYHNYDDLVFENLQQFEKLGGLEYLARYFKSRSKRFGPDDKVEMDTKNILVWSALNEDNFNYFNSFVKEFKGILENRRHNNAYWKNRLGHFYLKHKDYKNAKIFFETALLRFPKSNFEEEIKKGLKTAKSNL